MKYLAAILGLLFWFLSTIIMGVLVIPLLFSLGTNYWEIPNKLLKVFEQ
jgi:hypothetical protein